MAWLTNLFQKNREIQSFDIASYSDIGSRQVQEDSIKAVEKDNNLCCILCDGLGGHGMGDVASSIVVSTVTDLFLHNEDDLTNFLGQAFEAAQETVMAEQNAKRAKEKMKTTAVAMVTDKKKVYIGHIGDSRIYIFRQNGKMNRSIDHSIPQMLAITHEIKESEIRNHPDRNILLRVIGVEWEKPMYELMSPIDITDCEAFLLCSDGFWELIEEKDMKETLRCSTSAEEWLNKMIEIVNKKGNSKQMDNNSAIAVICNR